MAENTSGITSAILEKANADAAKIVTVAQQYAAAKISDAEKQADEYLASTRAETAKQCAFIRERGESNARINRKKALTGAKTDIVNGVFAQVRDLLGTLSADELAVFFGKIIEKYAESDDVAIISEKHADVVEKVKELPSVRDKGTVVVIGDYLPDGMLLSDKKADKDFTFAALADYYGENMRAEVADKLFGNSGR